MSGFEIAPLILSSITFAYKCTCEALKATRKSFDKIIDDKQAQLQLDRNATEHRKNLAAKHGNDSDEVRFLDKCIRAREAALNKLRKAMKRINESKHKRLDAVISKTHIESLFKSFKKSSTRLRNCISMTTDNTESGGKIINYRSRITDSSLQVFSSSGNHDPRVNAVISNNKHDWRRRIARADNAAAAGQSYSFQDTGFVDDQETGSEERYSMSFQVKQTGIPGRTRKTGRLQVETISYR